MNDRERLAAAVALALFLHFLLAICHPGQDAGAPALKVSLQVEENAPQAGAMREAGTGLEASAQNAPTPEQEMLNRKRKAYLRYLDEVDAAIHARRQQKGSDLIGVALCAFTIAPDGGFKGEKIVTSSGNPALDKAALQAIRSASGVVRRPAIIGADPINVSLQVKYQYDLE